MARTVAHPQVPMLEVRQGAGTRDEVMTSGRRHRGRHQLLLLLVRARRGAALARRGIRGAPPQHRRPLNQEDGQEQGALRPQRGWVCKQIVVQQDKIRNKGGSLGHITRWGEPAVCQEALNEPVNGRSVQVEVDLREQLLFTDEHLVGWSLAVRGVGVLHHILLLVILLALLREHVGDLQAGCAHHLHAPKGAERRLEQRQVPVRYAHRQVQRDVGQR
mmetsp:Transcript_36739/g.105049  ORF Transcript_36739/g.105049 Transcript_36739/m.105049 type:complete len:218 (+) Transcript_36739:420-1073(+)